MPHGPVQARSLVHYLVLAVLAVGFFCRAVHLEGADFYVRTDGGTLAQCSGRANAAYSGVGTGQPCAWDHPFRALPPGGTPRIAGGDTLHIGAGSYMMGFGAPGAENCEAEGSWDCFMPPIPSGPSASAPTRILGDCAHLPELWGTERALQVINLEESSNVEVACLEITDHSGCAEFHTGEIPCTRDTAPYGPWAERGIYASDSENVTLRKLDVHGLASTGIRAGRIRDWTVTDVRVASNAMAGWDADIDGEDWNEGTLRFTRLLIEWNGCGETWPSRQPAHCWAQSAGGYGDGFGTGATRGRWIFEESKFLNNTSDGLDMLYVRPGGSVEVRRSVAAGNAGNQMKVAGPSVIENSVISGNCAAFRGKPYTFDVDDCRAAGNALAVFLYRGDHTTITNCTIASEGDCVVFAGVGPVGETDGSERLTLRNNIFIGGVDSTDPTDRSCLLYWEGISDASIDADYSVVFGAKHDGCPGLHDRCDADPLLVDPSLATLDARLRAGSPAINSALRDVAPTIDISGRPRDAAPDIGAWEYGTAAARKRPVRRGPP